MIVHDNEIMTLGMLIRPLSGPEGRGAFSAGSEAVLASFALREDETCYMQF